MPSRGLIDDSRKCYLKQLSYMYRGAYQLVYPREENILFSHVCEVIHGADVPRRCYFRLMLDLCVTLVALLHPLTLEMLFFEVCLLLRCSFSICFWPSFRSILLLYEVSSILCEVRCLIHLSCDLCLLLSPRKSLEMPPVGVIFNIAPLTL